jgi:hypothetical protein
MGTLGDVSHDTLVQPKMLKQLTTSTTLTIDDSSNTQRDNVTKENFCGYLCTYLTVSSTATSTTLTIDHRIGTKQSKTTEDRNKKSIPIFGMPHEATPPFEYPEGPSRRM